MNSFDTAGRWLAVLICLAAAPAQAAVLIFNTSQSAIAEIFVDNVSAGFDTNTRQFGLADSLASTGSLFTQGARAAGRAAHNEFAANAQFAHDGSLFFHDFSAGAGATIAIVAVNPLPGNVQFDFFLPPTELEFSTFGEFPTQEYHATASATILIEFTTPMGNHVEAHFNFDAELTGTYADIPTLTPNVTATATVEDDSGTHDAGMDLSPLFAPFITRQENGSNRTINATFPSFIGLLDIGQVSGNSAVRVTYVIDADVRGFGARTHALAAINDPFALSSEPVMMGTTIFPVGGEIVPEPATATVFAALAVLAVTDPSRRRANCQ